MDEQIQQHYTPQSEGMISIIKKHIVLISSVLAIIVVLIVLGALLMARIQGPDNNVPAPTNTPSNLSPVGHSLPVEEAKTIPVYEEDKKIFFPIYKDQSVYYFSGTDSRLYSLNLTTNARQALSAPIQGDVENIIWSPTLASAIIILRTDTFAEEKWRYTVATNTLTKLDENIRTINFSPDGSRLSYLLLDESQPENPQLVLFNSDPDGSSPQRTNISFTRNQTAMNYITDTLVATYLAPAEPFIQDITFFLNDLSAGSSSQLNTDGRVFGALPSPNGNFFLSQHTTDRLKTNATYELYVVNSKTQEIRSAGENLYLEKSAWGTDEKIYTLLGNSLVLIDPTTLEREMISLPKGVDANDIDANSLLTTNQPRTILFTISGQLYQFNF